MKTRLALGFLIFVFLDIGLSFLFWIHGTNLALVQELLHFDLFTCMADLFLISFLRGAILIGAILGFVVNPSQASKRLKKGKLFANLVCMCIVLYDIVKLLLYWEKVRDLRQPWFWFLFVWTLIASLCMVILWRYLGSVKLNLRGRRKLYVNHVQEDGEARPLLGQDSGEEDAETKKEEEKEGEDDSNSTRSAIWQLILYSKPDFLYMLVAFLALLVAASCK